MRESYEVFSPVSSASDWWNLTSGVSLQEYLLGSAPAEAPQQPSRLRVVQGGRIDGTAPPASRGSPTHSLAGRENSGVG
jgi:hypothetical protein